MVAAMAERRAAARRRLSREDWAKAGYQALCSRGLSAVAVEPLARRLGVTKGSFYWHFADRDALLVAVFERWELGERERLDAAAGGSDARAELVALLGSFVDETHGDPLDGAVGALPQAADSVSRVSRARAEWVAERLERLGHDADSAAARALVACASFGALSEISERHGVDRDAVLGACLATLA
jgi:AcrR family transcriptional regulator